jgi:hypothetical protein
MPPRVLRLSAEPEISTRTDGAAAAERHDECVGPSYAVIWSNADGILRAGKLVLGPAALRLEGAQRRSRESTHALRYEDLRGGELAPIGERLQGLPTLVLRDAAGAKLRIASLDGRGAIHEVARVLLGRQLDVPVF